MSDNRNSITTINNKKIKINNTTNTKFDVSKELFLQDGYERSIKKNFKPNKRENLFNKKKRVKDECFSIPKLKDYNAFDLYNYSIAQLKRICKFYRLKVGGNKKQLESRAKCYLKNSYYVTKIQALAKGVIIRKYFNKVKYMIQNREKCVNDTDFLTLEDVSELPFYQAFILTDEKGFHYCFDICSLYNLLKKGSKEGKNPYNRETIKSHVIKDIRVLIRLCRILKFPVNVEIDTHEEKLTPEQKLQISITNIFQKIDELGNYSNSDWYWNLNRHMLIKFIKELYDIWTYRAQLSYDSKMKICPPYGSPFENIHINILQMKHINALREDGLNIINRLVTFGVDNENKNLGAVYVLGCLTLVNQEAAQSLPWLYESFYYQ